MLDPLVYPPGVTTNRRCIFCGGTPLTKEHVFPRWAHRLITGADPKGHAVIPDSYAFSEIGPALWDDQDGGEVEVIDNKPGRLAVNGPHLQTKSVCASCNNGWMSDLEAEVMPLISRLMQGQQVKASKDEASTLVRWAQKTCATLHQCGSADLSFIRSEALHALKAGESPPGQWHIRLARVTETNLHYYSHTPLITRFGKDEADATPAPEWYEQTIGVQSMFSIGGVLFIVRYSPYEFRGPTSLDCDLRTDYQSPPVLHGEKATRILKPWNWPVFTGSDLQYWTLWAVAPKSGLVALFEQPDGSIAVDEVTSAMESRDMDYQAYESRPGVGALFARTPKKRQVEVSFNRTNQGLDQVINGPRDDADSEQS